MFKINPVLDWLQKLNWYHWEADINSKLNRKIKSVSDYCITVFFNN